MAYFKENASFTLWIFLRNVYEIIIKRDVYEIKCQYNNFNQHSLRRAFLEIVEFKF